MVVAELAGVDGHEPGRAVLSSSLRSAERIVDIAADQVAAAVDTERLRTFGQIPGAYDHLPGRYPRAQRCGEARAEEAEQHHPVLTPHFSASTANARMWFMPSVPSRLPPRSPPRHRDLNTGAGTGQSRNCVINRRVVVPAICDPSVIGCYIRQLELDVQDINKEIPDTPLFLQTINRSAKPKTALGGIS